MYGAGIFRASPYNQIYADYATACSVTGYNGNIYYFGIYIDSPDNIAYVSSRVSKLSIKWDEYEIDNTTMGFYDEYASQLKNLISKSTYLILFSMISGVLLFLIVISFWNRNYAKDVGIYISLGENRFNIIVQTLIERLIIAAFGILLAIFAGFYILHALSVPLTPKFVSSNAENIILSINTGEDNIKQSLNIIITKESIFEILAGGIALILISTIIPLIVTMKFNVHKIFEQAE